MKDICFPNVAVLYLWNSLWYINKQKLEELKAEYRGILERFDELERDKIIGVFDKRVIIELSDDVLKEIARKYENI